MHVESYAVDVCHRGRIEVRAKVDCHSMPLSIIIIKRYYAVGYLLHDLTYMYTILVFISCVMLLCVMLLCVGVPTVWSLSACIIQLYLQFLPFEKMTILEP